MTLELYNIVSLPNVFIYTGYVLKEKRIVQYCISKEENNTKELYNHIMNNNIIQCGYNNMGYDYLILHDFIEKYNIYENWNGQNIAQSLNKKSEETLNDEPQFIPDKDKYIKQIDLYRIAHYKEAGVSLADLKLALKMPVVDNLPVDKNKWCDEAEINEIKEFGKNNIKAIYLFLNTLLGKTNNPVYKNKNQIELRDKIKKRFKINCENYPDSRIGETLVLKLYSLKSRKSISEIKKMPTTIRSYINLNDCIPQWAYFEDKKLLEVEKRIREKVVYGTKDEYLESFIYNNIKITYGLGGYHGCIKSGIYNSDDEYMIIDQDCSGMYPNISVKEQLYPEHLGPDFAIIHKEMVAIRNKEKQKPKKDQDIALVDGMKKSLNIIYGKSNDESSFLYDPKYTISTIIGVQMFILMWLEKLLKYIPNVKFLIINTDGICFMIPKKDFSKAIEISNQMSEMINTSIETEVFKKIIIKDVNNYIAEYEDGKCKLKGCFEIDKEYQKDPSMRIVPIALKEYFINNKPIEDTIKNHNNIYDFCLRFKNRSDTLGLFSYLDNNNILQYIQLPRTVRYYISNKKGNGILIKKYKDGHETIINPGFSCILFNRYEDLDNYEIDYKYYIKEANKIKNAVVNLQLDLFE